MTTNEILTSADHTFRFESPASRVEVTLHDGRSYDGEVGVEYGFSAGFGPNGGWVWCGSKWFSDRESALAFITKFFPGLVGAEA